MRWAALFLLLGCGGDAAVEVGASLLDHGDLAVVTRPPGGNVPRDVAESSGASLYPEIPADAWHTGRADVVGFLGLERFGEGLRFWKHRTSLSLPADAPDPVVLHDGREVAPWDPASEPFPGQAFHFDRKTAYVFAASKDPPRGVALSFAIDPLEPFADVEGGEPRRAVKVARETRDALLVGAPGEVAYAADLSAGDELVFGVGVVDRSWRVVEGMLEPAPGLSDGVTFRVLAEGQPVWERHVTTADGWVDARAALPRGTRDLRLVSDPGPAGDAAFDYAVWSGLRLAAAEAPPPSRPSVVLIDIDTLRADRVDGNTPALQAWIEASGAAVFTDARATAGWTLPSTMSMLTGYEVQQHGVVDRDMSLGAGVVTLAERLRAAGYETIGLAEGGYTLAEYGFGRGFDRYGNVGRTNDMHVEPVARRLAQRTGARPVFLFLQTYTVHAPYMDEVRPEDLGRRGFKPGEREMIVELYEAGIRRMDAALGELLALLDEEFARDELLVVITSDHGDELFEHGWVDHGHTLYDELLHVPLIASFPGGRPTGSIAAPVRTVDIAPTVLDVVGLAVPDDLPGRSLRGALPATAPRVSGQKHEADALDFGGFKLIRGRISTNHWTDDDVQLFDLRADPTEQANIAGSDPDRLSAMSRMLDDVLGGLAPVSGAAGGEVALDAEALDDLRELGYLGDG